MKFMTVERQVTAARPDDCPALDVAGNEGIRMFEFLLISSSEAAVQRLFEVVCGG